MDIEKELAKLCMDFEQKIQQHFSQEDFSTEFESVVVSMTTPHSDFAESAKSEDSSPPVVNKTRCVKNRDGQWECFPD